MDSLILKSNVSYLQARDPSIVAFNRTEVMANVRTNLYGTNSVPVTDTKERENIRVYLRIKKAYDFENLYEISGDTLICRVPEGSQCMRNMKEGDSLRKMYTFSQIFHPETTQTEIFNSIVKQKVLDFISGENSTLLTYGASGSGKTFTVIGTDEEPGLVPRSLEYLFRTLPKLSLHPVAKPMPTGNVSLLNENDLRKEGQVKKNLLSNSSMTIDRAQHIRTYTAMQQRLSSEPIGVLEASSSVSLAVWVSFAEIYNEQIYDLLTPDPPRGQLRPKLRLGSWNDQPYIKNLTHVYVSSGLEAYQVLQYGLHNLNYAETNLNKHSSRSHSIFTIKLVQVSERDGGVHVSNFSFCDLAGSERSKKTQNVGERLKESNNINSSLLVLGRCMAAIRNSQKANDHRLVPFRESKLTQLFQKALAGHEDIAMIVNISSKLEMFDETQHVLNFSAVAKDIAIYRRPPETVFARKNSLFSQMVESRSGTVNQQSSENFEAREEDYKNIIELLRDELEQQKNEFEYMEKMNRDHLIQGYQKLFDDMEMDAERRIKEAENVVRHTYEMKLQNMKAKYETMLEEESERNTVIHIDASDDEETDSLRKANDELKKENSELQKTVGVLKIESERKELEIKDLKQKLAEMSELKNESEYNLKIAVEEYCQMREKFEKENIELEERCLQLENEVEILQSGATHILDDPESNESGDEAGKENRNPLGNKPSFLENFKIFD